MEPEENIQLVTHGPEEYDSVQMMAKYWRSKSLPVVCAPPQLTPAGISRESSHSREASRFDHRNPVPPSLPLHHIIKPHLADIRESSVDSGDGSKGSGTRNSSIRSDNTNNTILISEKGGSERKGSNSSGQVIYQVTPRL